MTTSDEDVKCANDWSETHVSDDFSERRGSWKQSIRLANLRFEVWDAKSANGGGQTRFLRHEQLFRVGETRLSFWDMQIHEQLIKDMSGQKESFPPSRLHFQLVRKF